MHTRASDRSALLIVAMILLVAFASGGGGVRYALANLAVQIAALVALVLRADGVGRFWREAPIALRIAIIASLALPVLQIIPLPESVWSTLPGRELVSRSLALVGGGGWRPFSVDPLRTLLALTALITPLAVVSAGWTLARERLIDLGWLVVALGLFTVLLGAAQLGAPTDAATLYGSRAPGQILLGTFANRNSTGLFLTFALGLAALLPAPRPHPAVLPARLATCALLLLAIVLTQSRTALALAAIPVLLGVLHAIAGRNPGRSGAREVLIGFFALVAVAVGAGALAVAAPDRIRETLERFEAKDDPRRFIWDDATFVAQRYWPLGAGMGSFDEIYQVDESLENLTLRKPGRAHNDFIELTIEAGVPGLGLAAAWLVLIAWLSWAARRSHRRWVAWSGSAFLLSISLQSVTDYPLRNQTILALAGFALLMLARIATEERSARS